MSKGTIGRPRKCGDEAPVQIGFQAPRHLRALLDNSATRNRRSLSAEAIARLEQSFRDDRIEAQMREILRRLPASDPIASGITNMPSAQEISGTKRPGWLRYAGG